jgi:hypothetical protein
MNLFKGANGEPKSFYTNSTLVSLLNDETWDCLRDASPKVTEPP